MARNGSGTFSLLATLAPANTTSNSSTVNSIMDDIATGLTDSINVDGTKAFEANQPMGGFKLTNLASGSAATDSVNAGQVQDGRLNWADGGGTADAITASYTPAVTSVTNGDEFYVRATAANATTTPTFTPNSGTVTARTIVKHGNAALAAGDIGGDGHELHLRYRASDTKYELLNPKATVLSLASTTEVLTGTDTAKAVTPDALAALWEQGSDVASAGTISLGEGGYFNITGTTTITDIDFGTDKAGRRACLKFAGALTLTHNATTLILPSGANITTAAGDIAEFVSEGSDVVRCVSYQKATGAAVLGKVILGSVATTSGTTASFTGIDTSAYSELYFLIGGVSFTASVTMQIAASSNNGSSYGTAQNITLASGAAANSIYGQIRVWPINTTGFAFATSISATGAGAGTTTSAVLAANGGTGGPFNAFQFSGGTFDAGNIFLFGVP